MARKRIDPKLPIPTPDDPASKLDSYQDLLRRRLNELFYDSRLSVYDEGAYLGEADGINLIGDGVVASANTSLMGVYDITVTGGSGATGPAGPTGPTGPAGPTGATGSSGGGDTMTATASEAIAIGQFVAVFNSSGTPKCRVAKSSSGQGFQADGFCKAAFALGATATIFLPGSVNVAGGAGLTAGDVFLGTDGYATNTAPTTATYISQQIGVAEDATKVAFEPQPDILIGTATTPAFGGVMQSREFTSSGTFTVDAGVEAVWLTMVGGGGGGYGTGATTASGSGGGAGELLEGQLVPTTPGASVTVTIGAAGAGGASGGNVGADGGTTSFGSTWKVLGGGGGQGTSAGASGSGGGIRGAAGGVSGGAAGVLGTAESPTAFGGSSGGVGSASGTGGAGGGSAGLLAGGAGGVLASTKAGGAGGAATRWGVGGAGGNGEVAGSAAPAGSYGAGGGGAGGSATGKAGGAGLSGYVLLVWVA